MLEAPVFKKYSDFEKMLDYFAAEHCHGCRNEQCRVFKNCGVRPCHQAAVMALGLSSLTGSVRFTPSDCLAVVSRSL